MADGSSIEWTDATWNPIVGCSRVSPGCENCYAERFVHRGIQEAHRGLTVIRAGAPGWTGDVRFLADRLEQPQRWRRPRRIFVNSLSDLFHPRVSHEQRLAILGAMMLAPQHTYQVLTKRPELALEFESWLVEEGRRARMTFAELALASYALERRSLLAPLLDAWEGSTHKLAWWIGVTAEDQRRADERIPQLARLRILPTLRFVSYEPALGPVDFVDHLTGESSGYESGGPQGWVNGPPVDLLIIGGESGPGARPFHVQWARAAIDACRAVGTRAFVKQLGAHVITRNDDNFTIEEDPPDPDFPGWPQHLVDEDRIEESPVERYQGAPVRVRLRDRRGGDMSEWRTDLRVREMPEVHHAG